MAEHEDYTCWSKNEADKVQSLLDQAGASYSFTRQVTHDQRDGKMVKTVFRFNTKTVLQSLLRKF